MTPVYNSDTASCMILKKNRTANNNLLILIL